MLKPTLEIPKINTTRAMSPVGDSDSKDHTRSIVLITLVNDLREVLTSRDQDPRVETVLELPEIVVPVERNVIEQLTLDPELKLILELLSLLFPELGEYFRDDLSERLSEALDQVRDPSFVDDFGVATREHTSLQQSSSQWSSTSSWSSWSTWTWSSW